MPDRRIIEQRLKNLRHTRQVTEAMRMVSSVKLRRLQNDAVAGKEYVKTLRSYIDTIGTHVECDVPVFLRDEAPCSERPAVIVIGGDRGFAGGYYEGLRHIIRQHLEMDKLQGGTWIGVGTHVQRQVFKELHIDAATLMEMSEIAQRDEVLALAELAWSGLVDKRFDSIWVVGYRFFSTGKQVATCEQILPYKPSPKTHQVAVMEFEPNLEEVTKQLVKLAFISQIWQAIKESRATENVMRVQAMAGASTNAAERIEKLERERSHIRQTQITQELIEIVSGAKFHG